MCYFVLGFHVHEKAIIVVIALLALNAVESGCDAALFLRVCFVGTICLFPLLFEIRETCTAILILLTCCLSFYILLDLTITRSQSKRRVCIHRYLRLSSLLTHTHTHTNLFRYVPRAFPSTSQTDLSFSCFWQFLYLKE